MLALDGADLYYEVRGAGPALLIIPTGNGDAEPFWPLADMLADRYTVITYDRRGFSRSPVHGPVVDALRVERDAADARALVAQLGRGSAHVFGSSSGAIVALTLLERHPDHVLTLVCHEPPLASLLPDADRWLTFYQDLYAIYRREGVRKARDIFRATVGMSGETRPPKETELPPDRLAEMLERIRRNQEFWFEHEVRSYPAARPDLVALKAVSGRLVLAGGNDSRGHFPYRPNAVLAERLGLGIEHFPGGHVGYVTHPFDFAAKLDEVLSPRNP